MFVNIERKENASPISIDNWMKEVRDDGFSPDEALQILKWTNYYGNIKRVISEIRKYGDVKVYRMFKSFIIGAIDGRETSEETYKMLRELAVECGFEKEFDEADKNAKVYGPRDCNVVVYFNMIKCDKRGRETVTLPDFTKGEYDVAVADCECDVRNLFDLSIYTPQKAILRNLWHVTFGDSVGNMEELVFQNVKEPDFLNAKKLPKCLKFIGCDNVDLRGANLSETNLFFKDCNNVFLSSDTIFPEVWDLSGVKEVSLPFDFCNVGVIKLNEGKKVIYGAKATFSEVLDLSEFDEVDLHNRDLKGVKEIKFKEGARVNLANVKNLSPDIDLSMIKDINISGLDLSYMDEMPKVWENVESDKNTIFPKKMIFRANEVKIFGNSIANCEEVIFEAGVKEVKFADNTKFPEVLDLSMVETVDLSCCDLSGVKEIKFKEGGTVKLNDVKNLSKDIDLSKISRIGAKGFDLSYMDEMPTAWTVCWTDGNTCFPKNGIIKNVIEYERWSINPDYIYILGRNIENCEEVKFETDIKKVVFTSITKFPEKLDLSTLEEVNFSNCDLRGVKEIKFKDGAKVNLSNVKNLSKDIDLSNVGEIVVKGTDLSSMEELPSALSKVSYDEKTRFPKKVIFTREEVLIRCRNIANCEEVKFGPQVKKVVFTSDTIFPEVLDLSTVEEVDLHGSDLSGVKEIKFKKGSKVDLSYVKNLSKDIDLSMIGDINISGSDLSYMEARPEDWKTVKYNGYTCFPKKMSINSSCCIIMEDNVKNCEELILGSTVESARFLYNTVFPKVFSISTSSNVDLESNNFSSLEELKLKGTGCVKLSKLGGYPIVLDLSECENVELDASQIGEMNSIVFKDKEQRDKFMETMKFERGIDKIRFKRKCEYAKKSNNRISIKERGRCL